MLLVLPLLCDTPRLAVKPQTAPLLACLSSAMLPAYAAGWTNSRSGALVQRATACRKLFLHVLSHA